MGSLWAYFAKSRGLLERPNTAGLAAWISQLSVLIAAACTMLVRSRHSFRNLGWRPGPAAAYVAVFVITVGLVSAALGMGRLLGATVFVAKLSPEQALATIPILFVLSCFFAFAEEIGWRGYLLPKLLALGVKPALLVSSICWFAWELPLVLFGVLDAGLVRINAPAMTLLHAFQIFSAGVAFGYLRLRFNSVLLPTFAHGLLNTMGAVSFFYFVEERPFLADFAGPIGTALLLILAIGLFQSKYLRGEIREIGHA